MRIEGLSTNSVGDLKSKEMNMPKVYSVDPQQPQVEENSPEESKRNEYLDKALINTIEEANEKFIVYDRRFEFSVHEKTKEILIKVIDVKTDEVIREIPPEKILDMVAKLCELAGVFVDEKV